MISRLQLLRNVGLFDSVQSGANIPFARLTLIYGENGRGKTTLGAILRSLATGNPIPIGERHRLAAQHPPHVIVDCDGGPPVAMFQDGVWNRTLPNMMVFDDVFVDENVCSGLTVQLEHRQRLHELILGAQGVILNQRLQELVRQIEAHNAALRTKAAAIPAAERGAPSVDEFCDLPARADIDTVIQAAERNLAAANEQEAIRNAPLFEVLSLPNFDLARIDQVLQANLASLDAAAVARVQAHLTALGQGGEAWVAEGMGRVAQVPGGSSTCPFCAQDLAGSPLINHYRAYFSEAYSDLKRTVSAALAELNRAHGGELAAAFERAIRVAVERRQFWSRFCDVPEIALDTATIARDWRAAREAVGSALAVKQSAPLEPITLPDEVRTTVMAFERHRQTVATLNQRLQQANGTVQVVKEQAAGNPAALAADLARLKAVKARHTSEIATLCEDYLREKENKRQTEQQRDQVRSELNDYRTNVFPGYETAINLYLQRFNAGFRLGSVTPVQTRAGSACTYNVVINNTPVAVGGGTPTPGTPSFRNTLSSGDRNTLALAFFFASLDQDPNLANKVIVIDDPISSLDEHRSLTTVQEMRRLAERAGQVIVLSHNKPFLCRIWEGADRSRRTALQVAREGTGSTLRPWDVDQDCITEHDRRHAMLTTYLADGSPNNREVARAIRPHLEAFLRVACPEPFPPGTLLGPFLNLCTQRVNTPQQTLDTTAIQELRNLTEYANRYHHDTNPAWETEAINDGELAGFVERTLKFTKR